MRSWGAVGAMKCALYKALANGQPGDKIVDGSEIAESMRERRPSLRRMYLSPFNGILMMSFWK